MPPLSPSRPGLLIRLLALSFALFMPAALFGAFGLTTATDYYQVDTGAGLVFKVRRTDNGSSTQSPGDIMSLMYNGVEYQNQSRGSQVNSGFDWLGYSTSTVSVSAAVVNPNFVKVTVVSGDLTHYYMARNGHPHIYMGTYFTSQPVTVGALCRYIVRMPYNLLPDGPPPSDLSGTTGAIESADIFGRADGETRSKHYSNMRLKDWSYIGATGPNAGVWMLRDNHEGGSGGPFYRSLLNQGGGDQELTYIINYGEAQTEAFRTHVLNRYTLVFTQGGAPSAVDTSWFADMGLLGYVAPTGRGGVSCPGISNRYAGYDYTVGFANANAQFWGDVSPADGSFLVEDMLPGTYTMSVYKNELVVHTGSATVSAGATTALGPVAITADPSTTPPLWRIGDWDGSPAEFLNGDKVTTMHPSDVRMAAWGTGAYTVGTSTPGQNWPAYHWKDVPGASPIRFNLTAGQVVNTTVKVGITVSYADARPNLGINGWTSAFQSPSAQPDTRTLTVGTYRGNNVTYTFVVPASALQVGVNELWVGPISGSGTTGFLSAGYSYDCIEWLGPLTQAPGAPTGLAADNRNGEALLSWNPVPSATRYIVERAVTLDGPYTVLSSNVGPARYTDPTAATGTTYFYRVTAVNGIGTGTAATVAATPSTLHAHLKFDEAAGVTAADSTGDNDGALVAGATWAAGNIGNAVHLDGASEQYVELPRGVVAGMDDFTISTWVRTTSTPVWSRLFDFGAGTGAYMFLTLNSGSGPRFGITTGSAGGEQRISHNTPLSTGAWHHVAVTLSGSVGTLYVDGAAVASNPAITLRPSDLGVTAHNYIGKSQWPDPYPTMDVDDFRIHGGALTASQIATLAAMTPPAAPAALTASATVDDVTLDWSASSGAAGYNVKRSTSTGGPYTLIAGGIAGTSFTHSGAQSGVFKYVVTATNLAGESAPSPEAEALVVVIPALPVAPVAYYRFENGAASTDVPTGTNAVVDSAGGDDNMNAFNTATAPTYIAAVPAATIPQGGAANTRSLDFDGGDDVYEAVNGPLKTAAIGNVTVEAYVRFSSLAGWQTIVGRDDTPASANGQHGDGRSLFYLSKSGANNGFRVEVATPGNDFVAVNSNAVPALNQWYHVAAVGDVGAGTLTLYVDGVSVGSATGYDGLFNPPVDTAWTIGRGQYAGNPADNLLGAIDEVRVTQAALPPAQFLNFADPDDTDHDGLSDKWETHYFGNLGQTGTGDPDLDGANNFTEQSQGTPPASSAPPSPTGLNATAQSPVQIDLSWTASSGATSYNVKRATVSGGPYTTIATGVAGTTHASTGLTPSTAYYYVVTAVNTVGESPNSTQAGATTQATPRQNWRYGHFGTVQSVGDAADEADPDADGLTNLLEYALDSDPLLASPSALPAPTVDSDHLRIDFNAIADPDLVYTVQASGDLIGWTTIWTRTGGANVDGPVTVVDPVALSTADRRFLRLQVSTASP